MKMKKVPILFTIFLTFFLIYGLALANGQGNTNSNTKMNSTVKVAPKKNSEPRDLNFFKQNLKKGMMPSDVITVFGENYRMSPSEQSGEPTWMYDFPEDPTYITKVPPYAVDEMGILSGKMRYQLAIVWDKKQIKSYIVFYNHNGVIGELKGKFFAELYMNE